MDVIKTYSGKMGCMCGCRGKWNSTASAAEQRGAAIIAKKVMSNPERQLDKDQKCWYVEDRAANKLQAVYFS
jgi:hypothetical protein